MLLQTSTNSITIYQLKIEGTEGNLVPIDVISGYGSGPPQGDINLIGEKLYILLTDTRNLISYNLKTGQIEELVMDGSMPSSQQVMIYELNGVEVLLAASNNLDTISAYRTSDLEQGNSSPFQVFGPFTFLDGTGTLNIAGGDLTVDNFGQVYLSSSLDGALIKLDLDSNTAIVLNDRTSEFSSLFFDLKTQSFYTPASALISPILRSDNTGASLPSVNTTLDGMPYAFRAGDTGDVLFIQYTLPISIEVTVGAAGNEKIAGFTLSVDSLMRIDGMQLSFQGNLLVDNSVITVTTNLGQSYALVSYDDTSQSWTFNFLVDAGGNVNLSANNGLVSINTDDFTFQIPASQNNNFAFNFTAFGTTNNSDTIILQQTESIPVVIDIAPVTVDSSVVFNENTAYIFSATDFPFSDQDASDSLQAIRIESLPAEGSLEFYTDGAWYAVSINDVLTLTQLNAGEFRYVLSTGQADAMPSFNFTVSDGFKWSNEASMTLDITPVDQVLVGTSGNDDLVGGFGDDLLNAGDGNDTLIGGNGIDTFLWESSDTLTQVPTDHIVDFDVTLGSGDIINIADLLVGEESNPLENYLSFAYDGTDTTITVRANGTDIAQRIVLDNIDITNNNTLSDNDIITNLLNNNQLVIDT